MLTARRNRPIAPALAQGLEEHRSGSRPRLHRAPDADDRIDDVEELPAPSWLSAEVDRVLATVAFTDIVNSTTRAVQLGDRRWTSVLERHDAVIRRELVRARGREIKNTGDGFFTAFDTPARAVRWAAAVRSAVSPLGIDVRAGVHAGECVPKNGDLAGIAVHIGARICSIADPGEVLVSSTVKELVIGSSLRFLDRGTRILRGVTDPWHLYALDIGCSER